MHMPGRIEHLVYDLEARSLKTIEDGPQSVAGSPATAEGASVAEAMAPLFYDTDEFHAYHRRFCERVCRLTAVRGKNVVGWCWFGVDGDTAKAPYSAPFSLIYPRAKWHLEELCGVVDGLAACGRQLAVRNVSFALAPLFYSPEIVNAEIAVLGHAGFRVKHVEINHYFDLDDFESADQFTNVLSRNARKNYRRALKSGLHFEPIAADRYEPAYDIIRQNREDKGYFVKLSLAHICDLMAMQTSTIRCFGVRAGSEPSSELIASAIVFDITPDISQVIYWGDRREHQLDRPMALLAMRLIEHYKGLGKRFLDIGPSSQGGIINFGLADFKKSIGCRNSIKATFQRDL